MREIDVKSIKNAVSRLCIKANRVLPADLASEIRASSERESSPAARGVFGDMLKNLDAAEQLNLPICQDTGMAVVFAEIGQDVHLSGGSFEAAVNSGVRKGYTEGLLRLSVVKDPLRRENTNDNTPAVIHTRIVPGDKVKLTVAPKGFGSENMSALKMFNPSANEEDIIRFVTETVKNAGGNPCPPVVLGVGIGGDFEQCAYLAKKALCRPVSERNSDPFYRELETKMLDSINALGVGAQGFGGDITALSVAIEAAATHIAGLPVAVNVGCHVTRHAEEII
ncbi:MAG: fumarate hydratase [Clostridiales bacterium]|nr:fumarate hydratase [Clostridiales bacterium]